MGGLYVQAMQGFWKLVVCTYKPITLDLWYFYTLASCKVSCFAQSCLYSCTGFCRIFATELEDQRPKTVPYLKEVVE